LLSSTLNWLPLETQTIVLDYIRREGKQLVAGFLKSLSFPLVEGADWWPDKTNVTDLLFSKALRIELFLNHKISRCDDPRNPEKEIKCFKYNVAFEFLNKIIAAYPEKTKKDFWGLLSEVNFTLTVDDDLIRASIDHLQFFFEEKVKFKHSGRVAVPIILPIKDIGRLLTPNSELNMDWLSFVNVAFFEHSKAQSGDEEILIEDWEVFAHAMKLIEETDIRIIADVFMLGFLFGYQHMFVVYPFTEIDSYKRGTRQDYQRFEQCISQLENFYTPGMVGVFAKKFYKKENHEAAESFIKEAISDVVDEITQADDLREDIKEDVITRLQQTFIVAGYPKETIDASRMQEMYDKIELTGDDDILETTINIIRYNQRLENEPKTSWMARVNQLTHINNLKYLAVENVLYVPAEYIQHPYFHPKRSRFFNTATLYTEVVLSVNEGIKEFIRNVSHGYQQQSPVPPQCA
jgi:Peptidase family M13